MHGSAGITWIPLPALFTLLVVTERNLPPPEVTVLPPSITCVIPAYNREASIGRAIRSAMDQLSPPVEIIVVDDGSTDGTKAAVDGFGSRVRCITQENQGCASARNRGVHESQTEWVAFLDSDDYWTPSHLEKMNQAISDTQGKADYYFANIQRTASEGGLDQWQHAHFSIVTDWQFKANGQDWLLRPRIPMMLQAAVFSRERFMQKGGLWEDLRTREDTHCFLTHGIGQPICAVNHLGTVMTADEGASNRLTDAMGPTSISYWEHSVRLWRDVLSHSPDLDNPGRRLLEFRLFVAHWRLMRLSIRAGHPWTGTLNSLAAFRVSRRLFAQSLLRCRPAEHDIVPSDAIGEGLPD